MTVSQFERQRIFRNKATGATSTRIVDVLPESPTVDRSYIVTAHDPGTYRTIIKEVEIVPFAQSLTDRDREVMAVRPGRFKGTREHFLDVAIAKLEKVIEDAWVPGKFHLVLHSSGYDSRLTSAVIKRLWQRNGDEWLGQTRFACFGLEVPAFRKIMAYQGLTPLCIAYDDTETFVKRTLGFAYAGEWLNGPSPGVLNFNYVFIDLLQELDFMPSDNYQVFSGFGTDYAMTGAAHPKGNHLGGWMEKSYKATTSISFFKADDVVYQFMAHDFLEFLAGSTVRLGYDTRKAMVGHIDPKLLEFTRIEARANPPTPPQVDGLAQDYAKSWYGRKVRPNGMGKRAKGFEFHEMWANWTAAAFCENLIRKGYKLGVG